MRNRPIGRKGYDLMNKVIYRISALASTLCYIILLYQIWHLCQYGGIRSHLPVLAGTGLLLAAGTVLCVIMRRHIRKEENTRSKTGKMIWLGAAVCLIATVYFGGRIIYSLSTYNSALAWKIDEWRREEKVELTHSNFFDSGAEGVLDDLDRALDLPEELYVVNQFQMTFDGNGTIQTIYTFLYGKDADGNTRTYLIDYDAGKGTDMTVWKDGRANADYNANMKLAPMFRILEKASCKSQVSEWEKERGKETYEILYMGRRSFSSADGLECYSGDVDGDGTDDSSFLPEMLRTGGEVIGYEVSLHIPSTEEVTPVRYMMEPEYISAAEIEKEQEQQQAETAKQSDSWTVDRTDGSMTYFLNDKLGWQLSVVNAAAGSRAYELEKTQDGGAVWETVNQDSFAGNIGVAEGIQFFDEDFGFAALSGASQSYSRMYMTKDGGSTFTEIVLPMSEVTRLPEHAEDYGHVLEDYSYLCMPEKDGNAFTISVLTGAGEEEGIRFRSEDEGATWTYDGVF